jgi:hypothetical protein
MRISGPLYSTVDGTRIFMMIMIKNDSMSVRQGSLQILINHDHHENQWSIILHRRWNADLHDDHDKK